MMDALHVVAEEPVDDQPDPYRPHPWRPDVSDAVANLLALGLDHDGPEEVTVPFLNGGFRLRARCSRGESYPVHLEGPNYILQMNADRGRLRLQARSAWLLQVGPRGVLTELRELHQLLFREALRFDDVWRIAHIDLTADFVGLPVAVLERDRFVSRSHIARFDGESEDYATTGRTFKTGFEIGTRKSAVSAVIYNKTEECRRSPKPWVEDLHRENGWDGDAEITRIEFRLHGVRGLTCWSYSTANLPPGPVPRPPMQRYDLTDPELALGCFERWAPTVWSYLVGDRGGWLRYTAPEDRQDSNRSRWKTDPRWTVVGQLGVASSLERTHVRALRLGEVRRRATAKVYEGAFTLLALDTAQVLDDVLLAPEDAARWTALRAAMPVDDTALAQALARRLAAVVPTAAQRGALRYARRHGATSLEGAAAALGKRFRARVATYAST